MDFLFFQQIFNMINAIKNSLGSRTRGGNEAAGQCRGRPTKEVGAGCYQPRGIDFVNKNITKSSKNLSKYRLFFNKLQIFRCGNAIFNILRRALWIFFVNFVTNFINKGQLPTLFSSNADRSCL